MADDPTLAAIERIGSEVTASRAETGRQIDSLRQDLTGRLDAVVTRREHDAEVKRIDSEHRALAERHAALMVSADQEHADLRESLRQDQEERREIAEKTEARRRSDRRWYIGITISAIASVGALIGAIVSVFAR